MALHFSRYMTAARFSRELNALRAYRRENVDDKLLETLEDARLVVPHTRIRYPDPVARRMWLEAHGSHLLQEAAEPDGARWEAAVELSNALFRWSRPTVYGRSAHPLDDLDPRFTQFVEQPSQAVFQPWLDMRVDVSNDVYPKLFDACNIETYYTTWQLLLAAEVAETGVHFRVNLTDEKVRRTVCEAIDAGKRPAGYLRLTGLSTNCVGGFTRREPALNSIVWFAEEASRALGEIAKGENGRFWLNEEQGCRLLRAERKAAEMASERFRTTTDDVIKLCQFLAERWSDWSNDGRAPIADAYRDFLGHAVQLVRTLEEMSFADVRDRVGKKGGSVKPILDVIWPDWKEEEKDRARRTLTASMGTLDGGDLEQAHIDAFVEFIAQQEGLEAFFWRLRSFEDHAFRGNEFALEGMRSDLQGMAVTIEHLIRTLGGTKGQLYEMFKELWKDREVVVLLKRNDVRQWAHSRPQEWPTLKKNIEKFRTRGRPHRIAAELVMTHQIRGAVHHILPEVGHFELEQLFVCLMRAAALTFAHVRLRAQRT